MDLEDIQYKPRLQCSVAVSSSLQPPEKELILWVRRTWFYDKYACSLPPPPSASHIRKLGSRWWKLDRQTETCSFTPEWVFAPMLGTTVCPLLSKVSCLDADTQRPGCPTGCPTSSLAKVLCLMLHLSFMFCLLYPVIGQINSSLFVKLSCLWVHPLQTCSHS